jgi:hypothetical protein
MSESFVGPSGMEQLTYGLYRVAAYALLNWADDAAILAFMFC